MDLRYLFVDMNAFFASVEQQVQSRLRGRPVGVVPVMADSTSCIAASYEAKAYGVTTGTGVREAKARCPDIELVLARPKLYVQYHHLIIEAIESCLHVDRVASIDEMYGRLMGRECLPENASVLAHRVKQAIRESAGQHLRCSIGLGPNIWLAKTASKLNKPDGMTMILPEQMPEAICHLKLMDLTGIGRNMERRLHAAGVHTVAQLCSASESDLAGIWGSRVLGAMWWAQLHGKDLPPAPIQRRTVGHSHVLPPSWRTPGKAKAVAVRMLHKAAMRMRKLGYHAQLLDLGLRYVDGRRWHRHAYTGLCRDSITLGRVLGKLWEQCPPGMIQGVGVTLLDLVADRSATLPLYTGRARLDALADQMDRIDHKYGRHTIYLGGMYGAQETAPTRIAFTQIPKLDDMRDGG